MSLPLRGRAVAARRALNPEVFGKCPEGESNSSPTTTFQTTRGILHWQGRKRNGKFSFKELFSIEKIPQYGNSPYGDSSRWFPLCYVLLFLVRWMVFFKKMFTSIPGWLFFNSENLKGYCKVLQRINWLGVFIVGGIMAPYIEELHFCCFLLPRMAWMKKRAPVIEALLFALYHFWLHPGDWSPASWQFCRWLPLSIGNRTCALA